MTNTNKKSKNYLIRTITPTCLGIGKGEGFIDVPIARNSVNKLPILTGSSLKGILRQNAKENNSKNIYEDFGPKDGSSQGILSPQDAQILALPVASGKGLFVWVTSPFLLNCFFNNLPNEISKEIENIKISDEQIIAANHVLFQDNNNKKNAIVGELYFRNLEDHEVLRENIAKIFANLYWENGSSFKDDFINRLCIVSDDVLSYFSIHAMDVRARNRLDDNRMATDQALWYEEAIPSMTLFWGNIGAQELWQNGNESEKRKAEDALSDLKSTQLQIGGKASVGRGLIEFIVSES